MSVEVTPNGSYGQGVPTGPIKAIAVRFMRLSHRLGSKRMDGMPVVMLTTKGVRSGELRTTPVLSFPEGDSAWLVVAAFAGATRHPAWFVNLARNPADVWVESEGRRVRVTPRSLEGEERDRAWTRITEQSPRFTGYQEKTDRQIPVVRLTARS